MDLQVVPPCVSQGCETTAAFHGHGLTAAGLRRRVGCEPGRAGAPDAEPALASGRIGEAHYESVFL
jgi:hypothetical protein